MARKESLGACSRGVVNVHFAELAVGRRGVVDQIIYTRGRSSSEVEGNRGRRIHSARGGLPESVQIVVVDVFHRICGCAGSRLRTCERYEYIVRFADALLGCRLRNGYRCRYFVLLGGQGNGRGSGFRIYVLCHRERYFRSVLLYLRGNPVAIFRYDHGVLHIGCNVHRKSFALGLGLILVLGHFDCRLLAYLGHDNRILGIFKIKVDAGGTRFEFFVAAGSDGHGASALVQSLFALLGSLGDDYPFGIRRHLQGPFVAGGRNGYGVFFVGGVGRKTQRPRGNRYARLYGWSGRIRCRVLFASREEQSHRKQG